MFLNFLKSIFELPPNNRYYKRNKRALGLSLKEFLHLKMYDHWYVSHIKTQFYGRPFIISSPHWFLQSIEEIFIHEVYKFETKNSHPVIIDCGANWGLSVVYLKFMHPNALIIAYEADKTIYDMAVDNLNAFKFNGIKLYHKAIWDTNGSLIFSSEGSVGGAVTDLAVHTNNMDFTEAPQGSWEGNYNTYFGVHKTEEIQVESVRLKDILQEHPYVDFLKIDIEGAEYKVIKDCAGELHRVDKLFIEYHSSPGQPQLLDEILAVVKENGFRYYIKEASNNYDHPFLRNRNLLYDLQLNIFCFR